MNRKLNTIPSSEGKYYTVPQQQDRCRRRFWSEGVWAQTHTLSGIDKSEVIKREDAITPFTMLYWHSATLTKCPFFKSPQCMWFCSYDRPICAVSHAHTHTRTHTRTHTHARTHARTHTHTHTRITPWRPYLVHFTLRKDWLLTSFKQHFPRKEVATTIMTLTTEGKPVLPLLTGIIFYPRSRLKSRRPIWYNLPD